MSVLEEGVAGCVRGHQCLQIGGVHVSWGSTEQGAELQKAFCEASGNTAVPTMSEAVDKSKLDRFAVFLKIGG